MERNFHVLSLNLTGWKKKNREPQRRKLTTENAMGYKKDGIMATVERCEEKFSSSDQRLAKFSENKILRYYKKTAKKGSAGTVIEISDRIDVIQR